MTQEKSSTEELGYYISSPIYKQIIRGRKQVLESDLDRVFCVDGREGFGGKSTLTFQLAYAYDKTFSLSRICFSSKDFANALRNSKKGQAIVFDESFRGLSSKGSISKENKKLVQLLMECRQRNLFIFIVLPSFFLLEKYVAIFRSQALFHCYCSKKSIKRRYFKTYNYNNKKILYIFGKPMMSYYKPKIEKNHRFYAKFPPTINREAYKAKKKAAFQDKDIDEPEEHKFKVQRDKLLHIICTKQGLSYPDIAKCLKEEGESLTSSLIGKIVRTVTKNKEKKKGIII